MSQQSTQAVGFRDAADNITSVSTLKPLPVTSITTTTNSNGADYINDTAPHAGTWKSIQAIGPTVVAALTAADIAGTLTAISLSSGESIPGAITSIQLTSGAVIAYRA
jgi:hypothetical protein